MVYEPSYNSLSVVGGHPSYTKLNQSLARDYSLISGPRHSLMQQSNINSHNAQPLSWVFSQSSSKSGLCSVHDLQQATENAYRTQILNEMLLFGQFLEIYMHNYTSPRTRADKKLFTLWLKSSMLLTVSSIDIAHEHL